MKIERMTEIETSDIQIGDRLHVGGYRGMKFVLVACEESQRVCNAFNSLWGGG